ncbi:MAG: putative glycosyltransferase, exosortase G system-associated [Clostridium sp.]
MMNDIWQEIIFWGMWLIIPLMIDIIFGLVAVSIVLIKYISNRKKEKKLDFYPHITIIIPVYNSETTLGACIESIVNQTYPLENIKVLLIDNGSVDKSYEIYCEMQETFTKLRLWWVDSSQGKAKALNKGLYMSEGKYIINIDSDGILDKEAIFNMIHKFENDNEIYAMTGVVLTNHEDIKKTKSLIRKVYQKCELFEYCEAFLVGRGFQSETNTMFTLAGAFSAFRKEVVLKTQLYNAETLGEDTHMTFQVREVLHGKVKLCDDAFFFVDPVENMDKLYIQRQRWQRGQIEVSTLFWNQTKKKGIFNVLNFSMLKDHTLVFPRLIWFFAMIYMIFVDYPMQLIIGANIAMYAIYVLNSTIYFLVELMYLKKQKETKRYMLKSFYVLFILPIYRLLVFFMRAAGVLNAANKKNSWNSKTLEQEKKAIRTELSEKFTRYYKLKKFMNSRK